MSDFLDKILAEVCVDERIPDGIFDMSNSVHMQALFETLTDNFNFNLNDAREVHNKMIEGKYPERQAYNRDGLLVTFPTPQHKQKAISRGTHFEKDPTAGSPNVFGGGQQPAPQGQTQGQPAPETPATPAAPETPQQNVFPTGGEQKPQGQAQQSRLPASDIPQQASPQGSPSSLPASDTPPSSAPKAEVPQEPAVPQVPAQKAASEPPPPSPLDQPKTPGQTAAEAEVVKGIMNTDDHQVDTRFSIAEQWGRLEDICIQENYREALKVIRHIKAMDTILEIMAGERKK